MNSVLARNADEGRTVQDVLARTRDAEDVPVYPRIRGRRTVVREGRLWGMF